MLEQQNILRRKRSVLGLIGLSHGVHRPDLRPLPSFPGFRTSTRRDKRLSEQRPMGEYHPERFGHKLVPRLHGQWQQKRLSDAYTTIGH